MIDDRLPMDLGDDEGRPAAAEPVPAADRPCAVNGEVVQRAEEERERRRQDSRGRQLDNLQPHEAPIRHGVYARQGVYMRCDQCPMGDECADQEPGEICRHERAYVEQRIRELYELEWIDPIIDGPTVKFAVWLEIRMERAARYIAKLGEMHDGAYLPVAQDVQGLHNSWVRTLEKLGLTPPARKAMAEQGQGNLGELAAALLGERGRVVDATRIVDADFTVEDEGEPRRHEDTKNGDSEGNDGRQAS